MVWLIYCEILPRHLIRYKIKRRKKNSFFLVMRTFRIYFQQLLCSPCGHGAEGEWCLLREYLSRACGVNVTVLCSINQVYERPQYLKTSSCRFSQYIGKRKSSLKVVFSLPSQSPQDEVFNVPTVVASKGPSHHERPNLIVHFLWTAGTPT